MYLVAIGWFYVVLMMAVAEALSSQGSVLGAIITFVLYGLLPLGIVLYIMGTPMRRRARLAAEAEAALPEADADSALKALGDAAATAEPATGPVPSGASASPDGRSHAPAGGPVAPIRKEG
jgi:hypothetical protein